MKTKHCGFCNREYKINYFYTHLKQAKHKLNVKKTETKLLEIDNLSEKDNIKRILDDVIIQINNIIKNFLSTNNINLCIEPTNILKVED